MHLNMANRHKNKDDTIFIHMICSKTSLFSWLNIILFKVMVLSYREKIVYFLDCSDILSHYFLNGICLF